MNHKSFIAAVAASAGLHVLSLLVIFLGIWFFSEPRVPAGERGDVIVSFASEFPSSSTGIQHPLKNLPRTAIRGLDFGESRNDDHGISRDTLQTIQAPEGADASASGSPSGDARLTKIAGRINGAKFYPAKAREALIEGAPKVSFSIREDGSLQNLGIVSSSGASLLDEAALEAVRRAAPLPFYPDPIVLTLRYSLAHR